MDGSHYILLGFVIAAIILYWSEMKQVQKLRKDIEKYIQLNTDYINTNQRLMDQMKEMSKVSLDHLYNSNIAILAHELKSVLHLASNREFLIDPVPLAQGLRELLTSRVGLDHPDIPIYFINDEVEKWALDNVEYFLSLFEADPEINSSKALTSVSYRDFESVLHYKGIPVTEMINRIAGDVHRHMGEVHFVKATEVDTGNKTWGFQWNQF